MQLCNWNGDDIVETHGYMCRNTGGCVLSSGIT